MPRQDPPDLAEDELPHLREYRLPAGQPMWRVTRSEFAQETSHFKPDPAPDDDPAERLLAQALPERPYEELAGRFDGTPGDPFGVCYAALDDLTAIAETLLRDVRFDGETRPLPYREAWGRQFVVVTARRDLTLIDLTSSAGLAVARQDAWLIHTDKEYYWLTRRWAAWLRCCSKQADGLIWPSRRNVGGTAVALFADRCGKDVIREPMASFAVDSRAGLAWLNRRLAALNTYVVDPYDQPPPASGPFGNGGLPTSRTAATGGSR